MISRRNNYNYLLDILKMSYTNYDVNEKGKVFDKNGEEVTNERAIINRRFCSIYARAYQFAKGIEAIGTSKDNELYSDLALTDYNTFNSFINNCVNEYRLYDSVGTGTLLYIPYAELANFIFHNEEYKQMLEDYLKCELENIINFEKCNLGYVKRV